MTERLTIDRIGHRGDGIADGAGGPIYVSGALPGETVEVDQVAGHPDRRHLVHVAAASAERIAPICPHFGVCGGCAVQHWDTAHYRAWKRDLLVAALRQAGLDAPVADLIDAHGEGRRRVVFHARSGTHGVLEVVSRGGVKLAAALDHFHLDAAGRVCLDVGASTGGFTQVLLERGARSVFAVDVGRGQLHPSLRGRPQIVSLEATDIRKLDPSRLPEPPDFATVDVSFISLKLVLPAIGKLMPSRATLVALIKPQFEAPRRDGKKGIVRQGAVHAAVCDDIAAFLGAQHWRVSGLVPSPIRGGDGNREFFIEAERD